MVDYLSRPIIHEAFFKKYASKKFLKGMWRRFGVPPARSFYLTRSASILSRAWAKRSHALFDVKNPHLALDQLV